MQDQIIVAERIEGESYNAIVKDQNVHVTDKTAKEHFEKKLIKKLNKVVRTYYSECKGVASYYGIYVYGNDIKFTPKNKYKKWHYANRNSEKITTKYKSKSFKKQRKEFFLKLRKEGKLDEWNEYICNGNSYLLLDYIY